jgi:HK97 family phage major capsid protein
MTVAAMQSPEGAAKNENAVTFTSVSEKVRTVATWIPASKQVLDDFAELAGFIGSSLRYYLDAQVELQLLSGVGAGEDLNGLRTQATAFDTSLLTLSPGWNRIDIIGRAIEQLAIAKELPPTFVVMNPIDWWHVRLTKNTQGEYLLGDPQADVTPRLFTLKVIPTNNIASGTFLVGSGNAAASEVRNRMETQVEVSTEHDLYFTKNLVAIRAERRLLLAVKRPASYVKGTFSTSP